ncbi:MAG: SoxR reducing system RseC family protein [Gammaproteobacteria bacterium]|nr:SoxR reducing system RseC family protein [Gammaproteobacteria bacterium]
MFHSVRCAGCDGRCGVSVGGGEVPLDFEVANGTRVEVIASAHDLARRALRCFGWPLGAVGAAAFLAEHLGASEALIVAALFGAALAVVAVRAAKIIPDGLALRISRRAGTPDEGLRVVFRG